MGFAVVFKTFVSEVCCYDPDDIHWMSVWDFFIEKIFQTF